MTISREDVLGWARQVGIEVHERKQQARVGLDVLFGDDSTEKLQRMCELAAAAERRKHQADIEAWKAEAATAEKWRGMALAKDPMQPGKAAQEIQREAMEREREACAQAAERMARLTAARMGLEVQDACAASIRARSRP